MGLGYTILRLLFNGIFTHRLTKRLLNWGGFFHFHWTYQM